LNWLCPCLPEGIIIIIIIIIIIARLLTLLYSRQLSCQSVAVVITLVQTKRKRINIHKRNNTKNTVQTIQNTVNTSAHVTKTLTHYKTHTYTRAHSHITKQVKTTTVQDKHQMKWSLYNQVPSV